MFRFAIDFPSSYPAQKRASFIMAVQALLGAVDWDEAAEPPPILAGSTDGQQFARKDVEKTLAEGRDRIWREASRLAEEAGWFSYGHHLGRGLQPELEFSESTDECGFPYWERPAVQAEDEYKYLRNLHTETVWRYQSLSGEFQWWGHCSQEWHTETEETLEELLASPYVTEWHNPEEE